MLVLVVVFLVVPAVAGLQGADCPKRCQEAGSEPVCASDGVIYASDCEMKRRNCGNGDVVIMPTMKICLEAKGRSCDAFCYDNHDPVCGSNGQTYKNKCKFALDACREGIRLAHAGTCRNTTEKEFCPKSCPPPRLHFDRPVCASDGNVYRSECEMRLKTCGQKVVKASYTHCKSTRHCQDHCRKWYEPVCGSDKRLYSNACLMQQQNCGRHVYQVPMVYCLGGAINKFGCPSVCRNVPANQTVCGSDGNIYDNECELQMLNCGYLRDDVVVSPLERCHSRLLQCSRIRCGGAYHPVCGSDGRTYSNDCEFQLAVCKKGISRAHEGICHNLNVPDTCPKVCPPGVAGDGPVCGSDGNVYRNACEMKKATCGQRVVPVKSTMCRMTAYCDITCPKASSEMQPVCGSDNNLYPSECHLYSSNCGKHIYEVPLQNCLQGKKSGCKEYCPPQLQPVCGSDNKVYPNACFLNLETCRTQGKVRMVSTNSCGIPEKYLRPNS